MVMKLYGVPVSQPVRAVQWLLAWHNIEHEFVMTMPGNKKGSRSPSFLEINPSGTVPALVDDDGFAVWESHAILVYLAEKHGLEDLYPKDVKTRALIHQWFNWHHGNLRRLTMGLFAPKARPDIKFSEAELKQFNVVITKSVAMVEAQLGKTKFLTGETPTLADISAYEEIGQCQEKFANLFDFSPYPNVQRWINDMEALPAWEKAHAQPMDFVKKMFNSPKSKM